MYTFTPLLLCNIFRDYLVKISRKVVEKYFSALVNRSAAIHNSLTSQKHSVISMETSANNEAI